MRRAVWVRRAAQARRSVALVGAVMASTATTSSCASLARSRGVECAPVSADSMQTAAPSAASLVGRYRVEVRSSVGALRETPARTAWDLVLGWPDSATLALASRTSRGSSARVSPRLVGARRRAGSRTVDRVEWVEGLLLIGSCPGCTRDARDLLIVERLDGNGFRGSWITIPPAPVSDRNVWVSGPSTGRIGDEAEHRTRSGEGLLPTGYFCAARVGE